MQIRRTACLFIFVSVMTRGGIAFGGPADGADRHSWKTYTNARFQYEICYPADLMVPQGEPDNGDGQKFLAHDGAELIVYGSNNAPGESLKKTLADTGSRLAGPSGKVTYKMLKANWFVVSGQNGQTVFYSKVLYNKHDDQFKSFELTYHRAESALYEPVIARLAKCFTDLD
jgi:hypothetical protein